MTSLAEIRKIKQQFKDEFQPAISALGNNLATGITWDENGEYAIAANLTNESGKSSLPETYEGVKVIITVVGEISPQE